MINNITIAGRITKDLEIAEQGEFKVLSFSIAINVKKDIVNFIPCKAYNAQAENIAKFFSKGDQIILTGSLRVDTYNDKENNKKTSTYILINNFDFGAKKKGSEQETIQETLETMPKNLEINFNESTDDQLPF